MNGYSTAQMARLLKIGRQTLHRWIKDRPSLAPRKSTVGGVVIRLWTDRDVERVRKYKQENYRKGRGRKPKRKR
ncbi:MAG: MerR family transcriptional regulator [Terriglobia bacterium]